jgi:hypothetical protein
VFPSLTEGVDTPETKLEPEESPVAFMGKKEAAMVKKMLVLALLVPGMGGCIWSEDRGRDHAESGRHEEHREVVVQPEHVHCVGCGHVFRGGVWVNAD